jgi:aminoglycoside phosphotransferase (APT) family kinase protein
MPDARIASKEAIVQAEVAVQGYPTPTVRLVESPEDGIDGRALMIMDLAAGEPPMAGLGGGAAMVALPSLVRRLPHLLGQVLAGLHALDPAPVLARLDASGVALPDMEAMLDGFRTSAMQLNHDTLLAAGEWLAAHRPDGSGDVMCHGDMHPFNVLVDDDGKPTVLDWSAAVIAPRGYDLAFTSLMLAEPPLGAPRAVRPLLRVFGASLSRRFLRAYHRQTGAMPDHRSLAWFQGVICVRALTEVAWWTATDGLDDHAGHPWVINETVLIKRLRRPTGISVPHSRAQGGGGFHTSGPPR